MRDAIAGWVCAVGLVAVPALIVVPGHAADPPGAKGTAATGGASGEDLSRGSTGRPASATETAIRKALESNVTWTYKGETLANVLDAVANEHKIPVKIHKEVGNLDEKTVTFHAKGIRLDNALSLVLKDFELDWTVYREVLYITTEDQARNIHETRLYDIADLTLNPTPDGEIERVSTDEIMELLTTTVRPTTWDSAGGPGSIASRSRGGVDYLVISQTWQAHDEIGYLLRAMRQLRRLADVTLADGRKIDPKKLRELYEKYSGIPEAGVEAEAASLPPDPARDAAVETCNQFTFALFEKLAKGEGNHFASPYSVTQVLAMAQVGARGETLREFEALLPLKPTDDYTAADAWRSLRKTLQADGKSAYSLNVANALWLHQGLTVNREFTADLKELYDAEPQRLDFLQAKATADAINAWGAKQTADKIKRVINPEDLVDDQPPFFRPLVLTNAIYFKGKWRIPFRREATETETFQATAKKVQVPMMKQELSARYVNLDIAQLVTLPYSGGGMAMTFVLPNKDAGAQEKVAATLTCSRVATWLKASKPRDIDLWLPRFKFESRRLLGGELTQMGCRLAFDRKRADFRGIATTEPPIYLASVVQSAYVDVNEEGTEAAAVTGGAFGGGAPVEPPRPVVFHVDRPFYFFIHDVRTNAVLFVGRMMDPTAN